MSCSADTPPADLVDPLVCTSVCSNSVCLAPDGRVISTGGNAICIFKDISLEQKLKTFDTEGDGTSIALHNSGFVVSYLFAQERRYVTVTHSDDLSPIKPIAVSGNYRLQHLAVQPTTQNVVAVNRGNQSLDVCTIQGEGVHIYQLADIGYPAGLHILPDGLVLVGDCEKNAVNKYRLEGKEASLIWCVNVDQPGGISSDTAGYIYVSGALAKCINILSKEGGFLRKIVHPKLDVMCILDVFVAGDKLAVCCRAEGLRIFKIDREKRHTKVTDV